MWEWNDGTDVLMHHGILGQKWGVRRFQNPDGTWTEAGKERYGWDTKKESNKSFKWDNEHVIWNRVNNKATNNADKEKTKKVLKTIAIVGAVGLVGIGAYYVGKHYLTNDIPEIPSQPISINTENVFKNVDEKIKDGLVNNPDDLYNNKYWSKMPIDQKLSVKYYSSNAYEYINGKLRNYIPAINKTPLTDKSLVDKSIPAITKAIENSRLDRDVTTYRGISNSLLKGMLKDFDLSKPESLIGETFIDKGFYSTSPNGGFSAACKITTICPKGTQALYLGKQSMFPHEQELLLQRNSSFKVLDVKTNSLGQIVDLIVEVVDQTH